jgi:ABC-type cobalamin/Fe3+-siderophores transport system ATPase subunit
MKSFISCFNVAITTLALFPPFRLCGLLLIPFISAFMNTYVNRLLAKEADNIMYCLIAKAALDYVSWIVQQKISYSQVRIMGDNLMTRLHMSNINCGVPIPGVNQKQHKDLTDDQSKLRDFLFILPMLWASCVNFAVTIYMMETNSDYPIRFIFTLFCGIMCCIITYLTDPTVYEKTKPSATSVVKFDDSQFVRMKMSMGCIIDQDFEERKRKKIDAQQDIQKYVILLVNLITTYISLASKNIGQLHAFGNISWMIGYLADNIKSLQYYTYMNEFISFCKCLESHKLDCEHTTIPLGQIDKVSFVNTSFGYYSDDLMKQPAKNQKITNLSYTFKLGYFYYLEAPNGVGKSTIMRMFTSNLFDGEIFFGSTNRKNLSFEDICTSVFHIVQASEYTPKFSKDEIGASKGKDEWLEEQLGLKDLFDKDTVEMSGGQKKRMFIYIVLTSKSPIVLLDEILSELSTEETPDVPEGGGWLLRVIRTLSDWQGRCNKIMILVGHGLFEFIPKKPCIVKLKLENTETKTILSSR